MKKILSLLSAFLLIFALFGCSKSETDHHDSKPHSHEEGQEHGHDDGNH